MSRESARDWYEENRYSWELKWRRKKANRKWYLRHSKEHIRRVNKRRDERRKEERL